MAINLTEIYKAIMIVNHNQYLLSDKALIKFNVQLHGWISFRKLNMKRNVYFNSI